MKMTKNRYLVIIFLVLCVVAAFGTCMSIFSGTKDDSDLPITPSGTPEIILHRTGYTSSYNRTTKQPNWVAWHLTKEHVQGTIRRASNAWHEDSQVPKPRVNNYDYKGSGWSRGHMCPAGDNKWSRDAMYETFLYSNVCPQHPRLNSGDWNEIEIACRRWAERFGDVYIVCGPVPQKTPIRTIGRNKVWVPREFFKVVLCLRGEGSPKAIGFIYPNASASHKMFSYAMSVDEVERRTGIDFFPQLDDRTEDRIEADRGYF